MDIKILKFELLQYVGIPCLSAAFYNLDDIRFSTPSSRMSS